MKKVLLIGKFDDATKEIGGILSEKYQVILCFEEEDIIKEMLTSEKPDFAVLSLSGSAIAAREKFTLIMPYGVPILGIGNSSDEAELFISGILTEPTNRFLAKPAKPEDILRCMQELGGEEYVQPGTAGRIQTEKTEGKTILMVDDDPGFLRIMEAMLSKKYKVSFATSGAQAIAAVGRSKPDLILLDYEMPVCDGRMTLEMLRSEEDMKDIPVIFLTGMSDARYVSRVVDLRPEGYLLKPCSEEMVFSMIERVLSKSEK